jgi:hypothetical protein
MGKILKDLSSLKFSAAPVLPPAVEKPVPPKPVPVDQRMLNESASDKDLFSRMLGGNVPVPAAKPAAVPVAAAPQAAAAEHRLQERIAALEKECAGWREKFEASEEARKKECGVLESQRKRADDLSADLAEETGRREKAEREAGTLRTALAQAVRPRGLLNPCKAADLFEGETAEQIRETLEDALKAATQAGRERRAEVLAAVLEANPSSGILEQKRKALEALLGTCTRIGPKEIAGLEALGFTFISGKNHHKFKMGNFSVTISKTPSDWRSNANLLTEIKSRFF